jgi:hypothetical protein
LFLSDPTIGKEMLSIITPGKRCREIRAGHHHQPPIFIDPTNPPSQPTGLGKSGAAN